MKHTLYIEIKEKKGTFLSELEWVPTDGFYLLHCCCTLLTYKLRRWADSKQITKFQYKTIFSKWCLTWKRRNDIGCFYMFYGMRYSRWQMKMPYRVVVMGSKLRKKFIIPHRELPILNQIILLGQCNALLLREWRWSRGPDRSNRRMSWDCGEGGRNDCHCCTDSRNSLEMDGTLDFDCYILGGQIIWI